MELALDVSTGRASATDSWVSILVFVELALDAWKVCSPYPSEVVSILVFVELALDGLARYKGYFDEIEFQSLFSWNLLLMLEQNNLDEQVYHVSILVFVELALDGRRRKILSPKFIKFQSLFSWNLLLMFEFCKEIEKGTVSFNPCFRGTCS